MKTNQRSGNRVFAGLIPALFAVALALPAVPATAAPLGTAVFQLDTPYDQGISQFCAYSTLTNESHEVAGVPVNFGDPDSPTYLGGLICFWSNPDRRCESYPDSSKFAFNYEAVPICHQDCSSQSFITTAITDVTGSVADLLGDVVYGFDGDMAYTGVYHQVPDTLTQCGALVEGQWYLRYAGTAVLNAFAPVATEPGADVSVATTTTYINPITGSSSEVVVDIGFAAVGTGGETVVTASSNNAAPIESNFAVAVEGYQATFLDISTTAAVAPPIVVCTGYPDADNDGLIDGTSIPESAMRLLHGEGSPAVFTDRTISQDADANRICAEVSSLSPFVAVIELCGNGALDAGEDCDDGNAIPDDGCTTGCTVESGWACSAPGLACTFVCGNSLVDASESCDDGNALPGDGCSAGCQTEPGWQCQTPGAACAFVCGDGTVGPGEECDDGDTEPGDGCSGVCTQEACHVCAGQPSVCTPDNGASCDDGNPCTTPDQCDAGACVGTPLNGTTCDDDARCTTGDVCVAGACQGTAVVCTAIGPCFAAGTCSPASGFCSNPAKSDGASCDDGSVCTTGDSCMSGQCAGDDEPLPVCRTAGKSSLSVTLGGKPDAPDHAKDKLSFKWVNGALTVFDDLGDPDVSDGYALCVYDLDGSVLERSVAPGGNCPDKPCWTVSDGKGVQYKDKSGSANQGITALKLQAGADGKAKAQVAAKGAGAGLSSSTLELTAPVVVQLRRKDSNVCFGASFAAEQIDNDGVKLKARASAP